MKDVKNVTGSAEGHCYSAKQQEFVNMITRTVITMTKFREVQGMIVTPFSITFGTVTLRVTKDDIGQSLSLADDKSGFMLQIPIEPVADLVKLKGR